MQQSTDGRQAAIRAKIIGSGSYVPEKILTNDDLARMVDTSDEWISTRTGIKTRYITRNGEGTGLLASEAAQRALANAGLKGSDIDLILVGTVTPEMVFPSTACFVQKAIGAPKAWAFDLAAACSGFVYSLYVAQQFIENHSARRVMVIGADTLTKLTDWEDRTSCILFGDGAGAVILEGTLQTDLGILYSTMGADGNGWEYLNCQAYGSRYPACSPLEDPRKKFISIQGREIYAQAVRQIVESVEECLDHCQLTIDNISMLISHQMNARIIESAAKRLNLSEERVFINIAEYGNTSAASIPIAFHECVQTGRVQQGNTIIFVAFGAGLTWGANVVRL
jgi:3-oxoacyl-[acyl-carrier-protein] synthase-3